jgi:acyl carrier protein
MVTHNRGMIMGSQHEHTQAVVVNVIKELSGPQDVNEFSDIIDDLGFDSLDVVDLILSMEKAFGIEIPDEDVYDCKNPRASTTVLRTGVLWTEYVERRMQPALA